MITIEKCKRGKKYDKEVAIILHSSNKLEHIDSNRVKCLDCGRKYGYNGKNDNLEYLDHRYRK